MDSFSRRLRRLADDLRRRGVFHAGALYWIGSLAVLGALDLVRELLPWLDRIFGGIVLTAILLFPVVLIVAWAFDRTPEGIRLHRPPEGPVAGPLHRAGVIAVLTLATVGFGWAVLALWSRSEDDRAERVLARASGPDPTRIAVLYFDDYSLDGSLEPLAGGLTEGLITALGNVESLTVTSRNGVRPYRDSPASSATIARELGVGTLVTGSLLGEEGRIRVFAQLVDVTEGDEQLWSGRFERDASDVLTLQAELVEEISDGLRQGLGVAVRSREAALGTDDDEAWLLLQEARQLREQAERAGRGEFSMTLLSRAEELLEEAHERDPGWGAPPVEAGWVQYDRSAFRSDVSGFIHPADSLTLLESAERAVRLTDGSAEALELRGVVRYELAEAVGFREEWRALAEEDLLAAIRKEPDRARALHYLATAHRFHGEFREAAAYARRALAADAYLEDVEDVLYLLYNVNVELKEWDEADRWCRAGRERFRPLLRFLFCRLQYEALRPQVEDPSVAWALLDTLRQQADPRDWSFQYRTWGGYQVARVLARSGMPDSARAVLEEYRPPPEDRAWFAYDEAHVHLVLGDRAGALELLELYLTVAPDRRVYLPSDWMFEDLWDDPAFQALVAGGSGP